jgi:glycosyltransferase involved in cell wall biosynthesis
MKTKVLYVFNASTHYYNLVLNRLQRDTEYDIELLIPSSVSANVGAGVFQTTDNLTIKLHQLEEKPGFLMGSRFVGFASLLWRVRPRVIVILDAYKVSIFLNLFVYASLKLLGIRVVLKSIPFRLPLYRNPVRVVLADPPGSKYFVLKVWRSLKKIRDYWIEQVLYAKAIDAHVCYVEKAWEIYPTYGVRREKIFITYNSPDTDVLLGIHDSLAGESPLLEPNPHRIIHVGRLVDWKRVDLLVEAVRELKAKFPKIELIVVGEGPQKQEWQELSRKYGLDASVRFVGAVYDLKQLGRYFHSSAVYVLAGMGGLSINDAMAFGRPIVCSEGDGTEVKLVRDGHNGFYFRGGDAHDLAEKIAAILGDSDLCKKMGERSLEIIRKEVNIQAVLRGYVSAFDHVLGRGGAKA